VLCSLILLLAAVECMACVICMVCIEFMACVVCMVCVECTICVVRVACLVGACRWPALPGRCRVLDDDPGE